MEERKNNTNLLRPIDFYWLRLTNIETILAFSFQNESHLEATCLEA